MSSCKGAEYIIRPLSLSSPAAARKELERIGVDPGGIARMLPKIRQHTLLISQVPPPAANIIKQEMLSIGGDAAVTRGTVSCSVKSTDLLLIGTEKQLKTVCGKLAAQPFGLKKLSIQLSAFLEELQSPRNRWLIARGSLTLDLPLIMGILNITPDSFSDGGRFLSVERAVEHALQMEAEGADIIDIGGESTRPGAPAVSASQELDRLLPVIQTLSGKLKVPISVDTWKSEVADQLLQAGASVINDISGLRFDPAMAGVVARHGAGLVLMHTRGTPQQMQQNTEYDNLLAEVTTGLLDSVAVALSAGVTRGQIVIDPGICFAKSVDGNLELLQRLSEIAALGYPVMLGTSRKSFIGKLLEREIPDQRIFGTAATVAIGYSRGARIFRVHDVAAMRDVAMMAHFIASRQF